MDLKNCNETRMEELEVLKNLSNYEYLRNRIFIRLLNPDTHKSRLENLLSVPFLDVAVTFAIAVGRNEKYRSLIRVSKDMAESWNVSAETIFADALENERKVSVFSFGKLVEMMKKFEVYREGEEDRSTFKGTEFEDAPMYAVYEDAYCNGSAALILNDRLGEFASVIGEDMIILPSSITELICLPESFTYDMYWLKSLVREVNDSVVPRDEILSYSVYKYSRAADRVEIVA